MVSKWPKQRNSERTTSVIGEEIQQDMCSISSAKQQRKLERLPLAKKRKDQETKQSEQNHERNGMAEEVMSPDRILYKVRNREIRICQVAENEGSRKTNPLAADFRSQ